MLTVWGEGRGFRVAWLLEEMGLSYKVRPVDLLTDLQNDKEFLAINPAGFIPALQDGDVVMVESIAIMQYLMTRYGPTPLSPAPNDPAFSTYLQFLHMGEAGLAGPINVVVVSKHFAPEAERNDWSAGWALNTFKSRLGLVQRQLAKSAFIAGDAFTAADISVTYALLLAHRTECFTLGDVERSYVARTTARPSYARAMESCQATKAWAADVEAKEKAAATNTAQS